MEQETRGSGLVRTVVRVSGAAFAALGVLSLNLAEFITGIAAYWAAGKIGGREQLNRVATSAG